MDLSRFEALTFDCYGTLIDWEHGILDAVRPILRRHGIVCDEEWLLGQYARAEAGAESGPWRPYREVLAEGLRRVCRELGVEPTDEEAAAFGASVGDWPAFPDSADALARDR